jgi:hypothetical protein
VGFNNVIQCLFKKGMSVYRLDERFEAIDRRFERIEGRLERLLTMVRDHTLRLDRIETRFGAAAEMRERVAVLEALMGRRPA